MLLTDLAEPLRVGPPAPAPVEIEQRIADGEHRVRRRPHRHLEVLHPALIPLLEQGAAQEQPRTGVLRIGVEQRLGQRHRRRVVELRREPHALPLLVRAERLRCRP